MIFKYILFNDFDLMLLSSLKQNVPLNKLNFFEFSPPH